MLQTLVNEMRIMLELDHPSIVACHGVFYELGMFKIIMEYCDAGSLLDVMRLGDHTIPADALAGMMLQVLEAMAYLHTEKRVIHRDVKPGNILLNRQGQCKLADFGVCSKPRDTRDSTCATWVGTVTYMSPERIKGNSYSFSADVWALGVIVVEATLGRCVHVKMSCVAETLGRYTRLPFLEKT
jgi:mitogen-activated protein kinase kinase 1